MNREVPDVPLHPAALPVDGLISAICSLTRDGENGVPWTMIPTSWRAALIIGSAEATGNTKDIQRMLRRLDHETVVATIAADLER
jgi:hypothetical protein